MYLELGIGKTISCVVDCYMMLHVYAANSFGHTSSRSCIYRLNNYMWNNMPRHKARFVAVTLLRFELVHKRLVRLGKIVNLDKLCPFMEKVS